MQQVPGQEKAYRLTAADLVRGARLQAIEGAMPPVGDDDAPPPAFALLRHAAEKPRSGGFYVVELIDGEVSQQFRIVVYVDLFGRAFAEDEPIEAPPAREPDLLIAERSDAPAPGEQAGYVYVRAGEGGQRIVAEYRCHAETYRLADTWFDFGAHGSGLAYHELMARAYVAFVERPKRGAVPVPTIGFSQVMETMSSDRPLADLWGLTDAAAAAAADPALRVPGLIACLCRWLDEAGLGRLRARHVDEKALRLVKSTKYAKLCYLAEDDGQSGVHAREWWALEAALNRFALVRERLGDDAPRASEAACAWWDARVADEVAAQALAGGVPDGAAPGRPGGTWDARCRLSVAIEQMRLPFRVEARSRIDWPSGEAAFELTVPDGALMPAHAVRGSGPAEAVLAEATADDRRDRAERYAMHVGLLLARAAFDASAALRRVSVTARALPGLGDDDAQRALAGEAAEAAEAAERPVLFRAAFDASALAGDGALEAAVHGDPRPLYRTAAQDGPSSQPLFAGRLGAGAEALPESADAALSAAAQRALGAAWARDMRIEYDTVYRRAAERLADEVVRAERSTDAIRAVRAVHEDAIARRDERAASGCTRLMESLADGTLDARDQNAVVGRFLGEDRCLVALGRAKALVDQKKADEAVEVLKDAVAEARALDGFVDGARCVYRSFDSYGGRLLYNLARAGRSALAPRAQGDASMQVELVPDSFYLCHLEIVRLLEHSFGRTDEALRYGQRALAMAPATASGFRQVGRAYMLVGDMDNAASVLREGLRIAVQPSDIALLYYQLAYVLWKAGRTDAGAACYIKSMAVSPVVALQATAELKELVEESDAVLPPHDEVDGRLADEGIPLAPTDAVIAALDAGAAAADDEGMQPVARALLALRLRWRPDDALMGALRSLDGAGA